MNEEEVFFFFFLTIIIFNIEDFFVPTATTIVKITTIMNANKSIPGHYWIF